MRHASTLPSDMLSDMLSPKSLNSTGSSNPQTSPNVRNSSSPRSTTPHSSPLATMIKGEASPQEAAQAADEERKALELLSSDVSGALVTEGASHIARLMDGRNKCCGGSRQSDFFGI